MELNEFLETFGVRMGQIEAMGKQHINRYSFKDALQNFADMICKKQRETCAKIVAESESDMSKPSSILFLKNNIENAVQPKIEKL
jgi:hypothetical protein